MLSTGFWLACLSKPVLYLEMSLTIFTAGCCSILIFVEQLHFQCKKRKLLSFFSLLKNKILLWFVRLRGRHFCKKKLHKKNSSCLPEKLFSICFVLMCGVPKQWPPHIFTSQKKSTTFYVECEMDEFLWWYIHVCF